MPDAQRALAALAFDSQADIAVSEDGDLLYRFDKSFRSRIAGKYLRIRAEPAIKAVGSAALYMARVSFGLALLASTLVTTVAVIAISSSKDDDRCAPPRPTLCHALPISPTPQPLLSLLSPTLPLSAPLQRPLHRPSSPPRRRSSRIEVRGDAGLQMLRMVDMWYWFDPFWPYSTAFRPPSEMGFFESVGSFLWGDADPNRDFSQERWAAAGEYIQARGGVVLPEEIAQFSDMPYAQLKEALR